MNAQERETLTRFLQGLVQARPVAKDVEAERMIRENCNYQPDASYLLVQRALVLEEALQRAQAENAGLRAEVDRLRAGASRFADDNAWGSSRPAHAAAPAQPTPAAMPGEAQRGSGMLGAMAGTAAGVVAGSLLFHGIEQMMSSAKGSGFISGHAASARGDDAGNDAFAARDADAANDNDGLASLMPDDTDLDSL